MEFGGVVAHIHVEGYGEALFEELVEQAPALRGGGCGWQGEYDFVARDIDFFFLARGLLQPKLIGQAEEPDGVAVVEGGWSGSWR